MKTTTNRIGQNRSRGGRVAQAQPQTQLMTRPIIERLLLLAQFITGEKGMNVTQAAMQLEVSPKTIHRDKDFLRDRLQVEMDYNHMTRAWHGPDNGQLAALKAVNPYRL